MARFFTFLFTIGFFYISQVQAQENTVGLLSYQPWKSFDGYNMIYPHNQPNVYLLNNCGEIVHTWTDSTDFRPGNTAYLLENGNLVKTRRPATVAGNPIWAGGGGGTIQIRSWDNELIWSYTMNDSLERFHHDIAPMPNGNILAIAWELKNNEECIEAGRDTALLDQDKLWPEKIVEINPNTDEIVWEWHVWDHLIQDHDETKENYGVVEDHPELVNLNYTTNDGHPDWLHANAIDYDEVNDLIVLSVPTFDEVWVIDHSTSTEQAASHVGGFSGVGGDLMYRWGNPLAYNRGTVDDQKLHYQHDIHWNNDFLSQVDPNYGKLAVFNNRVGDDYSSVHIINHGFDMYDFSFPFVGNVWGPEDFDLSILHPTPQAVYSTGLSSVQFLPNNNVLICSGRFGYSVELTSDNEIVWEYKTPIKMGAQATQGDTLEANNNLTFRLKRYPTDYAAFDGKTLDAQGYLELEPNEEFCAQILPVMEEDHRYKLKVYPNPASEMISVEWNGGVYVDFCIYDLYGRPMISPKQITGGKYYVNTSDWLSGMYIIVLNGKEAQKIFIR